MLVSILLLRTVPSSMQAMREGIVQMILMVAGTLLALRGWTVLIIQPLLWGLPVGRALRGSLELPERSVHVSFAQPRTNCVPNN